MKNNKTKKTEKRKQSSKASDKPEKLRSKANSLSKEKNLIIFVAAAIVLIIAIVGFGLFYTGSVGQAISFGNQPVLAPVNLVEEQSFIFTTLPAGPIVVPFNITDTPFSVTHLSYNFTLQRRNQNSYNFTIRTDIPGAVNTIVARDELNVAAANDLTTIYLNTQDPIADLSIAYQNSQIVVTNLHYLSEAASQIDLYNSSGDLQTSFVHVQPGATFSGLINATSLTAPTVGANVTLNGQTTSLTLASVNMVPAENYTSAMISWQAPNQATSAQLSIEATVQGRTTTKHYTFAVGDVVYAMQQQNVPGVTVTRTGATTASVDVTLAATTQLQTFALPCQITQTQGRVTNFFADNGNVARLYSYNNNAALIAARGSPADFTTLDLFNGYFIQLENAQATTVTFDCSLQQLLPASIVPNPQESTRTINTGWNLLSIPGTVPRPLSDFVGQQQYQVYACAQNYVCNQVNADTPLMPGRAYWIYAPNSMQMRYRLQ